MEARPSGNGAEGVRFWVLWVLSPFREAWCHNRGVSETVTQDC